MPDIIMLSSSLNSIALVGPGLSTARTLPSRSLGSPLWDLAGSPPSLDLNFAQNRSLNDAVTGQNLITFTRASEGTYVDSDGLIKTAAINTPRFDHNPVTGESLGLLVEESRANLLLRSEEFGTTWTTAAVSVTANQRTAPDGILSMDTITATGNAGFLQQAVTVVDATVYNFSIYVYSAGNQIRLIVHNGSSDICNIRWTSLSAGTTSAGGTSTNIRTANVGNSVYRLSFSFTSTSTTANIRIQPLDSSGAAVTGATCDCWGAQLEAGAFPTSYIPTTTTAVTRSADVASITGSNFSSWYRQAEGSFFGGCLNLVPPIAGAARRILEVNNGTEAERMFMGINTSTTNQFLAQDDNVVQVNTSNAVAPPASRLNAAFAYQVNNMAIASNGGSVAADASATVCTPDRLTVGSSTSAGNSWLNAPIARLTYWPTRLSDSTLQALTQ